jgi:ATP-binding cassette subfamily B multidrug efflux pump
MLTSLLGRYLRTSKGTLALVVVLQLCATIASLYLPSLNADIIGHGRHHVQFGDPAASEAQVWEL